MNFYSYSSLYSDLDLGKNFVFLYVIGIAMGVAPSPFQTWTGLQIRTKSVKYLCVGWGSRVGSI